MNNIIVESAQDIFNLYMKLSLDSLFSLSTQWIGGMCRFELRIEEADFETFGGGGGYMVGGNQL